MGGAACSGGEGEGSAVTTRLPRPPPTPAACTAPPLVQAEEELPERLIGSVRFEHLDLKTAAYLDDENGKVYKNEK